MDIAGKEYWDNNWKMAAAGFEPVDLKKNYIDKRINELLERYVEPSAKVLEMGCANSKWLPYMAKEFNCEITGIDYSEKGVEKEIERLEYERVKGEIICCDFNYPPNDLYGKFDFLVSFGVIEHFSEYHEVLQKFSEYLHDEGRIITIIPNFFSITGTLQKLVGKEIYDKHVTISLEDLVSAHESEFDTEYASYFGCFNAGVVNFNELNKVMKKVLPPIIYKINTLIWIMINKTNYKQESKSLSPYIVYVGKKSNIKRQG